jgi:rfaE bifunctional protein kinase chain/domain
MPRVPDFSSLSVVVAGDLIADHWIHARPRQLSREAPVMVLRHERERLGAGGAASIARVVRALGADVSVLGAVGRDANGRELLSLLESEGIDTSGVELVPATVTTTRTRILAAEPRRSHLQLLRIDREPAQPLAGDVRVRVAARAYELGLRAHALIVADHEYGCLGPELGAAAGELARKGKVSVLDPRSSVEGFAGVTAITPDVERIEDLSAPNSGRELAGSLDDPAALRASAEALRARADCRWVLVARGNLGMALFGDDLPDGGVAVEASAAAKGADLHGASDTAAAVFSLALSAGLEAIDAMVMASAACGAVDGELGAAVCTPAQLADACAIAPAAVRLSSAPR